MRKWLHSETVNSLAVYHVCQLPIEGGINANVWVECRKKEETSCLPNGIEFHFPERPSKV